jgi:NADPH2:quinone reductase
MSTLTHMHAVVLVAEGSPDMALELQQVPVPTPASGEVRIRVRAASLNHLDVWIRQGLPSVPKPRITGADALGVVDLIGDDAAKRALAARGIKHGDRVLLNPGASCGNCTACERGDTVLCDAFRVLGEHVNGTHAQYVVVPAGSVHPAPTHLADAEAAALGLVFATAWRRLFTRAQVRAEANENVLVWGASSGVGSAALQLCAAAGITTIATTRSAKKAEALRELGATHVIVTSSDSDLSSHVVRSVRDVTAGVGCDVVFDHLGEIAWRPSMEALRRGGRYVTCGASTGANPPAGITRLFWKQLSMLGSTMASESDMEAMLSFVSQHTISPRVDRCFSLQHIADAHDYLESAHQVGKVVLDLTRLESS